MEVYKAFREVQAGHGKMEDVDTLLRPQVEAILRVHEMMEAIAAEGTIDASAALAALLADDGARTGGDFDAVSLTRIPLHEDDKAVFMSQRGPLRTYFSTCQFVGAWNRLMFHSDAMFNTVLLVLLTIATHLTVNPMAAYALSRFNLGYTYKVLLLLLATMAFPPAVAMVPNFLMLKSLHLLNTYWALVLPGMANGYSIFLLKGFFDALPKELYEAAEIDGASPVNCFVNITFPMSKPIFAINALSSFNFAYTGFMWAFVRCPDPRKWTLMVHVFNDNQWAIASVQMAILVIASVPTLLMFLFCQKVILRGIIIPSFK
jgi:multiple sugar transport system permease protein